MKFSKFLFVGCCVIALSCKTSKSQPSKTLDATGQTEKLRKAITEAIETRQLIKDSGVSVSVFSSREILLMEGFGFKDRTGKTPVTPHTLFSIGSTTKAFTAMSILMLQEEGALNINDTVVSQLPEFQLNEAERTQKVEIADLLSHATGLPRHDLVWYLTPFSREELIKRLPYLPLNPKPGFGFREAFQYNNLMFMTAGRIVEKKSGVSWEDFVQEKILNKLGMNETSFSWASAKLKDDLARPYRVDVELDPKELTSICPAGCIVSNVHDMTKWIQLHLRKGMLLDQTMLLNRETFAQLLIKKMPMSSARPDLGYGLAWMMQIRDDLPAIYFHGGNIDGFTAMVMFVPSLDVGVVVLENQEGSRLPNDVGLAALRVMHEAKSPAYALEMEKTFPIDEDLFVPALEAEQMSLPWSGFHLDDPIGSVAVTHPEVTGLYQDRGYGDIEITQSEDSLWFNYYTHHWKVTPKEELKYIVEAIISNESSQLPIEFKKTESDLFGELHVVLENEVGATVFKRY